MMIENTTPEEAEIVTKFNQMADNLTKLSKTGTSTSMQLFIVLRRLKYIESYLPHRDQKYKPFDETKDEASAFVNMLFNDEIELDDLDPDKHSLQ